MESIKEIYKIGYGPSSSHTMGPRKASEIFLAKHPECHKFEVTLYGSLAATGKGHLTDYAVQSVLSQQGEVKINWQPEIFLPYHPNGMTLKSFDENGKETDSWTVYSIGGGSLSEGSGEINKVSARYTMRNMSEIKQWCERTGKSYWEYVKECEDEDLWDYLAEVWKVMREAVKRGLENEGVLPGPLNLRRKAGTYYIKARGYKQSLQSRGLVFAYALAVSEENAGGGNSTIPALVGAESLLGRNPFGNSPAGKSGKDEKTEASLELTCACFIDGKWNFVITDIESKISYAVVLKGRISDEIPYRVDFFDEDTMSVVISNSISEFVITLKSPDEPAPAPPPPPKAAATAQKTNQQSNRQNRYRMWIPPQRVEVPKAKRINWR